MLRIRNVQVLDCDQPLIECDEFATELHECDFDKISSLLTTIANELAVDHHRFDIAYGGWAAKTEHE